MLAGWLVLAGCNALCQAGDHSGIFAAAASGDVEQLTVLVGDDPNLVRARDTFQRTPLSYALRNLQKEAADYLLSSGAGLEVGGRSRDGVLHVVLEAGQDTAGDCARRKSLVSWLLAHGADVNAANDQGKTPLHIAAMKGRTSCLNVLLEAGASIDGVDKLGRTALHDAAMLDQVDVINWLVSKKADVNKQDKEGNTPLHAAMLRYRSNAAARLIELGASVNARNREGRTPLHIACMAGPGAKEVDHLLAVAAETLLTHGANVDAIDNRGATALSYSRERHRAETLAVLRRYGAQE